MIANLVSKLKQRVEARRQYRKLVSEIATLNQADLIEMGAFEVDLYRAAYRQVYG